MLHTKFCENRPAGSGGEDFSRVYTIYGRGGNLGHVTWTIYINFRFPFPRRLNIKFGFDWPSGFRREDFENVNRRTTTDGRTPDPWVSYKLTGEPSAPVSKKKRNNFHEAGEIKILAFIHIKRNNYTT